MESKRISMAVFMAAFMVFMIMASAENEEASTMAVHLNDYYDCLNKCVQEYGALYTVVCGVKCAVPLADPMAATKTPLKKKENNEALTVAAQVNSFADCNDKCLSKYGDLPYTAIGCGFSCTVSLADSTAATRNPLRKKENDKASTVAVHSNDYYDCLSKCIKEHGALYTVVCGVSCAVPFADPIQAATKTPLRKKGYGLVLHHKSAALTT